MPETIVTVRILAKDKLKPEDIVDILRIGLEQSQIYHADVMVEDVKEAGNDTQN